VRASAAGSPGRLRVAGWRRLAGGRRVCGSCVRFGAERFGAGDAVGVEYEGGGPARGEVRDAAEGVRVVERAVQLGVEDGVDLSGFVAAGVTDWLLAFLVCPACTVGDDVAVVVGEEVADDRFERVELAGVGSMSPARRSWPSPRLLLVASA